MSEPSHDSAGRREAEAAIAFFASKNLELRFTRPTLEQLRSKYLGNGFLSETEVDRMIKDGRIGPVVANLHSIGKDKPFWPYFGTGQSENYAAIRAREHWRSREGE